MEVKLQWLGLKKNQVLWNPFSVACAGNTLLVDIIMILWTDNLSASELKKLKNKQRKAARKAAEEKAAAEEAAAKKAAQDHHKNNKTGGEQQDADKEKKVSGDWFWFWLMLLHIVNQRVIFFIIKFPMKLIATRSTSDWLFITL